MERAEERAKRAEESSASLRAQQERRVANLEARLQELSETVGTYDRLRQQDQASIQKLKDRVQQLDQENSSLQSGNSIVYQNFSSTVSCTLIFLLPTH